jgi:uncharacterized protein YdaL
MNDDDASFREQAGRRQRGFLAEFAHFAAHNKKWWLTPILVLLFLIGILVLVGGTGAAPFIYTLF